ncbi:MAG: phosphatidylglycerophosphatase A [Endomicrobium sp.]|jgi:phosphatidylglycerophosphatase A|nr:phosphatidylglycerophosphatase A [Endomicrobium sp.]
MKINKIIFFFSSVAGLGYIKYAPGTFASLASILLWVFFIPNFYIFQVFMLFIILIFAILFSSLAENIYNNKDDQRIVIDEFIGVWFSVAFLPKTFSFLGFLLFRVFDIKKPLFIKQLQKMKNGLGITADDIISGVFVNIILQVLKLMISCVYIKW